MYTMAPTVAALYLRLSVDRRGDELGVSRQREDCLDLISRRGWTLGPEFTDNDTSASGKVPRPGFASLLDAIRAGRVKRVVAWNLDRVVRTTRDRLDLVDACQRTGAMVALVRGTDLDPGTPGGRLHLAILQEVAQHELDVRHDRQVRAFRQRAEKGLPWGPNRPFGYERDGVTIRESEAQLVRDAYRAVLAGETMYGIAQRWNDAGIHTTFGKTWSAASVRQMLIRPRYAGLRAHRGEIVAQGTWKGLVDEEMWRAAVRVMKAPGRRRPHPVAGRRYLLSGLAVCGRCGELMTSGLTHHGKRTYRCRRFDLSRDGDSLDAFIERVVVARMSRPDGRELLAPQQEEGPDLAVKAAVLRQRLEIIASEFGSDLTMSPAEYRAMREPILEQLAEVEEQLANRGPSPDLAALDAAPDVETWWGELSLGLRRAVVNRLMQVTVLPAVRGRKGFDPASVRIEWCG